MVNQKASACLRGSILIGFESVLVHDPVGFLAVGGPAFVEDQSLTHTDEAKLVVDGLVPSGGLPEAGHGCPVGSCSRWVLLVLVAKKVPFCLFFLSDSASFCFHQPPQTKLRLVLYDKHQRASSTQVYVHTETHAANTVMGNLSRI